MSVTYLEDRYLRKVAKSANVTEIFRHFDSSLRRMTECSLKEVTTTSPHSS